MNIDRLIIAPQGARIFSVTYQTVFVKIMRLQCGIGRFRTFFRCNCQSNTQKSKRKLQNQFESLYRQHPILIHMHHLQELTLC